MPILSAPYNTAARARQHTWLTIGGGAVLVPLVVRGLTAYIAPESSLGNTFGFFLQISAAILGMGILPALLFAFLREPVMRRLFSKVSQLTTPGNRAAILLIGTLLIFLSYVAVAVGFFSLYMWLEGPSAHRLSYWQYLAKPSDVKVIIVSMFAVCGMPWLLAALASAWYVNRDLLPGASSKVDEAI